MGLGSSHSLNEINTHNCKHTHVAPFWVDTMAQPFFLRLSFHRLTVIFFFGWGDGVEVHVDMVDYVDVVGVRALLLSSESVVVLDRQDLSTARVVFHLHSQGLYPLFHSYTAVATSVRLSQDSAQHF